MSSDRPVDPQADEPPAEKPQAHSPSGSGSGPGRTRQILERLGANLPHRDRYRVEGEIARGGMGIVLDVWDDDLRRRLAMKVSLGRRSGSGEPVTPGSGSSQSSQRYIGRFLEEAQVTAQLDHPGIVPVHELGMDTEGRAYFTMRLVEGEDLSRSFERVAAGEPEWTLTHALGVLLKVCEAMAYAHSKGVIHRDLKPSNIMVGRFGEAYVMDWGLARVLGETVDEERVEDRALRMDSIERQVTSAAREGSEGEGDTPLITLEGDLIGTPSYMSPEQGRGEHSSLGPPCDVYSLGAILYELCTSRMPFVDPGTRPNALAVWTRLREGAPEAIEKIAPATPAELVAICEKAMAREPGQRYPDMLAMAEDLRAYLEGRVVGAHATGPVVELRKWVQRNRALALALSAVFLVVLGALSIVAWQQTSNSQSLLVKHEQLKDANAQMQEARDDALAEKRVADAMRTKAEGARAASERSSYFAAVVAAALELDTQNPMTAGERLDSCPTHLRDWEWEHLNLRRDLSLSRITGHVGDVLDVAFMAQGAVLLTAGQDGSLRRWDASTGERAGVLLSGGPALLAVSVSADSRFIACIASDRTLILFDGASGAMLLTDRLRSDVSCLAFDAKGERLFIGASLGVWVYGVQDLGLRAILGQGVRGVRALAVQKGGGALAVVGSDGRCHLYDVSSGRELAGFHITPAELTDVCFDPAGERLAATDTNGDVHVWRIDTSADFIKFQAHLGAARSVRFHATEDVLYTAGDDALVRVWDIASGELLSTWRAHGRAVGALACDRSTGVLASASSDGTARLWDGETREVVTLLEPYVDSMNVGRTDTVHHVLFDKKRRRLITGGQGALRIWDGASGHCTRVLEGHAAGVQVLCLSSDGRFLLSAGGTQLRLRDLDSEAAQVLELDMGDDAHSTSGAAEIIGAGFDPAGAAFWVASRGGLLRCFDRSGEPAAAPVDCAAQISQFALAPDGLGALVALTDGRLVLFDLCSGEALAELPGHDALISSIVFQADGDLAASADERGVVYIWNVDRGVRLAELRGHRGRVSALAFGPDGRRLFSAGEILRVWDVQSGETLAMLDTGEKWARTVAVSHDGARLLAGFPGGELRLWESRLEDARGMWRGAALRERVTPDLHVLFAEHVRPQVVLRQMSGGVGWGPEELEALNALTRSAFAPGAHVLCEDAETITIEENRSAADYAYAVRLMQSGLDGDDLSAVERRRMQGLLGRSLFRLGQNEDALLYLLPENRKSKGPGIYKSQHGLGAEEHAINCIFHALAEDKLGNSEGARAEYEKVMQELEKMPGPRLRTILKEARQCFEETGAHSSAAEADGE